MSIVEFLTARLAEDAEQTGDGDERRIREIEFKRRIITEHGPGKSWLSCRDDLGPHAGWKPEHCCVTVQFLAAVYADHPDYDPAWAVRL